MKKHTLTLAVIAAMLLSGCAVAPVEMNAQQSALLSDNWVKGEGEVDAKKLRVAPAQWWASWNDESLNRLVEATLKNNTDIAVAQANLRSARASVTRTGSSLLPGATLSGEGSENRRDDEATQSYNAGAAANWSLSFGGRNISEHRAALAESKATELTLEDVKSAMTSEVASQYIQLRLAQRRLEIAKDSVKSYEEAKNLTQWRYQAGLVEATDYEQANAQYENARASVATNRHNILRYQTALSRLTVLPLAEIQALPEGAIPQPPENIAVSIPAEVVTLRPDVLAVQESVRAALENVRVARADFFPTLNLTGSIGTTAATVSALGTSGTGIGALVAALSMPILNWGDAIAGTETQKANVDAAQARYTSALVTALEETENALSAIRSSAAKKHSLRIATQSSNLAADLALQQYSSGLQDYQTVLSTQRSWLTAQDSEASNDADWATAHVDLYQALGGGWTPEGNNK